MRVLKWCLHYLQTKTGALARLRMSIVVKQGLFTTLATSFANVQKALLPIPISNYTLLPTQPKGDVNAHSVATSTTMQ